jgi:hypothetical protein
MEIKNDESDGDLGIIIHRLNELCKSIEDIKHKQEKIHESSRDRLIICEKNQALLQQSVALLSKQVDKNQTALEKNDLWTKIIGALTTFLVAVGTALVAYFAAIWDHIR